MYLPDAQPSSALIPPFRFAICEQGLSRGAYPTLLNMRFLAMKRLRTIVSLVPERPTCDVLDFCREHDIASHHFCVPKYTESVSITKEQVIKILQIIIDPSTLPCYVHCLDGVNVTGVVFACLRKLQNWVRSSIINEFCRFTFGREMSVEEVQFLDDFDGEVVVPREVPDWLWNGANVVKHSSIKLCQLASDPLDEQGGGNLSALGTHTAPAVVDLVENGVDRSRLTYFDLLLSKDPELGEDRVRHGRSKEIFPVHIRAMALESSTAITYRTRMLSLDDI
ncbi:Tyrosine specific protein phosphatases domain-containing protein [Plasmodiophora brassicae]